MSELPPTTPQPAAPASDQPLVQWRSVLVGALVALAILVVVSVTSALLDYYLDDFDNSGWIYPLFVGVLAGYAVGGFVAGRASPDGALTNGTLAGLGAFVLWVPVRIVIWVVRDEDKGLFSGHSAILRPGQIFGQLVIASALGMFGGWLGARAVAGRSTHGERQVHGRPSLTPGSEPAGRPRAGPQGTGPRNVRTPQGTVLGNTQSGRPAGQCNREQTADGTGSPVNRQG